MLLYGVSDFVFPYMIPNADRMGNTIIEFMHREQEHILRHTMSDKLYDDFINGLSVMTPLQKWIDLRDGKSYTVSGQVYLWGGIKSVLVPWSYSRWVRYNISHFTGIGTVTPTGENVMRISSVFVEATFYNEASDKVKQMIHFIQNHDYEYDELRQIGHMNVFSL